MRIVYESEWPGTRESLLNAVATFKAEREAHKFTEGVPAPIAPLIVQELTTRDAQDVILAADLPIQATSSEMERAEIDRALTDRWILDRLAKQIVPDKDTPDYVLRNVERISDAQIDIGPA